MGELKMNTVNLKKDSNMSKLKMSEKTLNLRIRTSVFNDENWEMDVTFKTENLNNKSNIKIIEKYINNIDSQIGNEHVEREIFFESYPIDFSVSEFYDKLTICLGLSSVFEITVSDSILERLNKKQRDNVDRSFYHLEERLQLSKI